MTLRLSSELLRSAGFRHGFSLREGGVSRPPFDALNLGRAVGDDPSAVAENHARFARAVGYAEERLYEVTQVHGADVVQLEGAPAPSTFREREADALVSDGRGCAVAVRVADCASILLADPASGAVAAVHAGWRGVVAGVVPAAVTALTERARARPAELLAALFPCIGVGAFEVGEDVAAQLAAAVGSDEVVRMGAGRPHADLGLAVTLQLAHAGIAAGRLERVPGCTFSEPTRFFSHRRDAGRSGRHLAVIVPRC